MSDTGRSSLVDVVAVREAGVCLWEHDHRGQKFEQIFACYLPIPTSPVSEAGTGRGTVKSKVEIGTRGAALVEYVILVGLIGVLATGSVLGLGERIKTTFNEVEDSLYAAQEVARHPSSPEGGDAVPEDGEAVDPLAPTFTWKSDGTDTLPPGVTTTSKGWIIDISSLAPSGVSLTDLRFNAWISQEGTVIAKYPGDPGWGSNYTVIGRSYWLREGEPELSLVGAWDVVSPSGDLLAYNEVKNGYVPDNATGIRLEQHFDCNIGSICTKGAFNFNIDFFTSP